MNKPVSYKRGFLCSWLLGIPEFWAMMPYLVRRADVLVLMSTEKKGIDTVKFWESGILGSYDRLNEYGYALHGVIHVDGTVVGT
jgi:hypothetical protein